MKDKVVVFWFRRDLRLTDNAGLVEALSSGIPVLLVFIFDSNILSELSPDDARVSFIYDCLQELNVSLKTHHTSLRVFHGDPMDVFKELSVTFSIEQVYANEDYEPSAIKRDEAINGLIPLKLVTDQVVFSKHAVLKDDQTPYTVYSPYRRKWLSLLKKDYLTEYEMPEDGRFINGIKPMLSLTDIGFNRSSIKVPKWDISGWKDYGEKRDFPELEATSLLGVHLRFGTVSVREVLRAVPIDSVFASELIWREFFMQILYHFPHVVTQSFKAKYDRIQWRNDEEEFEKWKKGETGYPLVDAGMRELNKTGLMHNRVRMVTASFLCKHLLIDWRWGEAYFAEKLLDYDLSANNGNWQWASGSGCDAAPYFRVFNPYTQHQKFDRQSTYVKKWVPEFDSLTYSFPMVEHKFARERALKVYKEGVS